MAYYLQLQDRIKESIQVFEQIDISTIQADGNDLSCQIPYDYMAAYFDFITDETKEYKKAREIVNKYSNKQVGSFTSRFKKIQQQLKEIDDFEEIKKQPFKREKDHLGHAPKIAKGDETPIDPE